MSNKSENNILNLIPQHIAFIADGNRRWAEENNRKVSTGHLKGMFNYLNMIDVCLSLGVKVVTVFALSPENLQRKIDEVNNIWYLAYFMVRYLAKKEIKVKFIGDMTDVTFNYLKKIKQIEADTQHKTKMTVNIALNYGGKWDILQSAQLIVDKALRNELPHTQVTEQIFQEHLSLGLQTPPDILVRTGGHKRISNFLLWDLAYTELFFLDKYWPEFNVEDVYQIIEDYQKINRNNGR